MAHFHIVSFTRVVHLIYVFLLLADGTHIYSKSYIKCDSCFFFIIVVRVFNIGVFNVVNEMCNLVSTRV